MFLQMLRENIKKRNFTVKLVKLNRKSKAPVRTVGKIETEEIKQ